MRVQQTFDQLRNESDELEDLNGKENNTTKLDEIDDELDSHVGAAIGEARIFEIEDELNRYLGIDLIPSDQRLPE